VIETRRRFQVQCLVRSVVIELVAEEIEGALLGAVVGRRWTSGFSFQSAMHSFMSAVLLWFAGFNQFRDDAETNEPGGESREAGQRDGWQRERHYRCASAEVGQTLEKVCGKQA
jgi:hypothetical protein